MNGVVAIYLGEEISFCSTEISLKIAKKHCPFNKQFRNFGASVLLESKKIERYIRVSYYVSNECFKCLALT